jgi:hypothetical protein
MSACVLKLAALVNLLTQNSVYVGLCYLNSGQLGWLISTKSAYVVLWCKVIYC